PSYATRCAVAALLSVTAERSSTTGLPMKKPAERAIQASRSASHSKIGGSGVSTKAIYERPRKRIERRGRTRAGHVDFGFFAAPGGFGATGVNGRVNFLSRS